MSLAAIPSPETLLGALVLGASHGAGDHPLFGKGANGVADAMGPYLPHGPLPSFYLEFPLSGCPRLDVTCLYGEVSEDAVPALPNDPGAERLLRWYAPVRDQFADIGCGLEFDGAEPPLRRVGVHFQPRSHSELVKPFLHAVGTDGLASAYQRLSQRMPQGWPLSFMGLFDGREASGLRVAGYLSRTEARACTADPARLSHAFEEVGFRAFDDAMLQDISHILHLAPHEVDFQFDLLPDGHVGDTFALDVALRPGTPESARKCMEQEAGRSLCRQLQDWGMADDRWRHIADAAWLQALPVQDGPLLLLSVMPRWIKIRWKGGTRSTAKGYLRAQAGPFPW